MTKRITVHASGQRLWDADALAGYRQACSADEQYMQQHQQQVASGKEVWVDCHRVSLTWVSEETLQIGAQRYTIGPLEEDHYRRWVCSGCAMDEAYCTRNHQIRTYEETYRGLCQKAKAALLPDGAVIRFSTPFDLRGIGSHDTFRKAHLVHRANNRKGRENSTVFYPQGSKTPVRIVNWQQLDFAVLLLQEGQQENP